MCGDITHRVCLSRRPPRVCAWIAGETTSPAKMKLLSSVPTAVGQYGSEEVGCGTLRAEPRTNPTEDTTVLLGFFFGISAASILGVVLVSR